MRIYISADAEGVTGVTSTKELLDGKPRYDFMRQMMTHDTNAAIAGAFEAGATEVLVNDSHWGMDNLIFEALDPRAEVIKGFHKHLCMMEGIQGCDAAFFVGYHSKCGHNDAVANETIFGREVVNVYMNGRIVGETEINAAIAGHFGVPVVLVTGDDLYCAETREEIAGVETAVTKVAIDRWTARCFSPQRTQAAIRQAAANAVRRAREVGPYNVEGPVTLAIEWTSTAEALMASLVPGSRRVTARRVEFTGQDIIEAWKGFFAVLLVGWSATDEVYG